MNYLLPLILELVQLVDRTHPQIDLVPQEAKAVAVPKALDQGLNDDQIDFRYNQIPSKISDIIYQKYKHSLVTKCAF